MTTIRPAFPAKGPKPTLATAIAAGTKITLAATLVADVVAARHTSPEAVARAAWMARNKGQDSRHGLEANPERDGSPRYMGRGPWIKAKAKVVRQYVKMAEGLSNEELAQLTEHPRSTKGLAADRAASAMGAQERINFEKAA